MRWIDTTIRDLIRWIDTTITTRGAAEPRDPKRLAPRSQLEDGADHSSLTLRKVRAVLELRHPVKTARRGGVGTPIEKAGAPFW